MKKADIKTGFLCNNNCRFCVQGHEKRKLGNKLTIEVKNALDEAVKDCEIVVFTGGEPTIRKDIFELVKYARRLGFKTIQIQSNGRMFSYEDFCKKIIKAGANEFSPALHGHTDKLHDWLTQSKGSFAQTVSGIKNLKQLGQKVITNTVITKSNYRHLPEIAKILVGLDVDQFQFAFVHALGSAAENFDGVVPRMRLVEPYLKKALDIGIYFKKDVRTEAVPFCVIKGYEDCVSESVMPDIKIFEASNIVIPSFEEVRIRGGKKKAEKCKKCRHYKYCEGPWREYPDRLGFDEFVPIKP